MGFRLDAVALSPKDFTPVAEAIVHYEALYEEMRGHLDVKGQFVTEVAAKVAGLTETIYASWSEIKAISQIMELRKLAMIGQARQSLIEHYNRSLSVAQVENYAKVDPETIAVAEILIQVTYVLDKWEGLSKGVERLHHLLRLIGDMRRAGMDDATI